MSWLLVLSLVQANVYFSSDTLVSKLKARIDAATSSIDLCIYNCDSSDITGRSDWKRRRRAVSGSGDYRRCATGQTLGEQSEKSWRSGLDRQHRPESDNLMHNKFAVFDRRDANPANDWVWTGSFNVAAGSYNADNAIEAGLCGLAHAYTQELEQMWAVGLAAERGAGRVSQRQDRPLEPPSVCCRG